MKNNSIAIRTNRDKVQSNLYRAIVGARKIYASTKKVASETYNETKNTVNAARKVKI